MKGLHYPTLKVFEKGPTLFSFSDKSRQGIGSVTVVDVIENETT